MRARKRERFPLPRRLSGGNYKSLWFQARDLHLEALSGAEIISVCGQTIFVVEAADGSKRFHQNYTKAAIVDWGLDGVW